VADVELRVVDDAGVPLLPGVVGEVQIRTFRTMSGYWGANAGATAGTVDGEGWVHSGDLGQLDEDGYLFPRGAGRGPDHPWGGEHLP